MLLALGKLAEVATLQWFGTSAAHSVVHARNVSLAVWGYGFVPAYQLAREQPTLRAKIRVGIIGVVAYLTGLLALAPMVLHQPLRPWLSAIILLGGIWSLILIPSIAGIRAYRKTSATPNPWWRTSSKC
ncbi:MAG TPA: hypothetical protein VMA09_01670 [Candidatus Binataceae bacterium]|nr:hypothetical protein [Candidatus Binataceae bacterium]